MAADCLHPVKHGQSSGKEVAPLLLQQLAQLADQPFGKAVQARPAPPNIAPTRRIWAARARLQRAARHRASARSAAHIAARRSRARYTTPRPSAHTARSTPRGTASPGARAAAALSWRTRPCSPSRRGRRSRPESEVWLCTRQVAGIYASKKITPPLMYEKRRGFIRIKRLNLSLLPPAPRRVWPRPARRRPHTPL